MPRLVKKTAHGPVRVGDKDICMCGLSKTQPFCDKSHLQTLGEDEKKLYWYENGQREEIPQEGDTCCDGECAGECSGECEGHGKGDKECCGHGCSCEEEEESPVKK